MKVLDKGHVQLVQHMGDDNTIGHAARASYADQNSAIPEERLAGMIRFMMDNKHGSVFEHCVATFEVKCPLMVMREWHRSRTQSYNEQSARYSVIEPEWYIPAIENVRQQTGKPGAYTFEPINVATAALTLESINEACAAAFDLYKALLEDGIAKEQARLVLPVNTYSQMWATANLRNWLHFLELRTSAHAMFEIREYANAIEDILIGLYPLTMMRFITNGRVSP